MKNDVKTHVKIVVINYCYKKEHNIKLISHSINLFDLHSIKNKKNYIKNSFEKYDLISHEITQKANNETIEIILKK